MYSRHATGDDKGVAGHPEEDAKYAQGIVSHFKNKNDGFVKKGLFSLSLSYRKIKYSILPIIFAHVLVCTGVLKTASNAL